MLEQLERDYKAPIEKVVEKKMADSINAAHYSTGMVAAGFTSTVMNPETYHEAAILDENVVRYQRIKKKGNILTTLIKEIKHMFSTGQVMCGWSPILDHSISNFIVIWFRKRAKTL